MLSKTSAQHLAAAVALLVALCLLVLPAATDDARALTNESFVPGQIIVKLAPEVKIGDVNLRAYGLRVQERFLNQPNADIYLLKVTDGSSPQTKIDQIKVDPLIEYTELNYLSEAPEADARHSAFPAGNATPTTRKYSNDSKNPPYPDSALNLSSAQLITQGSGTTVAVLDTGAQLNHPALQARFAGVPRYDFVDDDTDPSEPPLSKNKQRLTQEVVGHGTHVAGIVHLVAPQASIMPLRVLDREGYGTTFHVAEAISYADSNEADVINLSLGTPSWSRLLREKVDEAIGDGVVVAAAAGNYDSLEPQYPASNGPPPLWVASEDDGLIAVTSVNVAEKKSDFANYGTWVDIAAPGDEILSTYPMSKYAYWSGTSMATPFVSGEAALIHSVDRSLVPADVEERIRLGARCLDQKNLPPDVPPHSLGAGHADVDASLKQVDGEHCIPPVNP
ncbi:MAG: S8 family serine peptidase [Rubrobacteraceae bacterium]|nr:S8 family serine peptidase [Rubrobacteraceae bacterium]